MNENVRLTIVTGDARAEEDVASALESSKAALPPVELCADLATLRDRLEEEAVPVAFIDLDADPEGMLGELEGLSNQYVHTRFVALTSSLESDLLMRAMQAGVRHVQLKKNVCDELGPIIEKMLAGATVRTAKLGSAITVLSAGGGCGSTTLAVNLANELQLASAKPVLIVDMDYAYGAVASYLELRGRYGIADVLAEEGQVDPDLVRSTSVKSGDLNVLISPASISFGETPQIDRKRLETALLACKQGYAYTIVDAPRVPIDVAVELAEASGMTLIVFQPMVKDIRVAKELMASLRSHGIEGDRIRPVINRYRGRRAMITFEDAQKVLGDTPIERLSNDYSSALRGINFGTPLAESAPRSALRKDFVHLAEQFSSLYQSKNGHAGKVS